MMQNGIITSLSFRISNDAEPLKNEVKNVSGKIHVTMSNGLFSQTLSSLRIFNKYIKNSSNDAEKKNIR